MHSSYLSILASFMLASLVSTYPSPPPGHRPTATIDSGIIIGIATTLPNAKSGVHKFLGIPYSSPAGRWGLPRTVEPWHQPRDADTIGPICIQAWNYNALGPDVDDMKSLFAQTPPLESEDCLTINVFLPSTPAPRHGRAVVVFFHGGGFQLGGSDLYDLSAFAAHEDMIGITFNYRTNIFGFPASPALPLDQRNLGLLDQRAALAWVQRNIRVFGGDPSAVTVWGVSSGAESIDALLLTYPEEPKPRPFRAAILESGLSSLGLLSFRPADNNLANWNRMLQATNCSSSSSGSSDEKNLACLARVPAASLKAIMEAQRIDFPPVADNVTMLMGRPGRVRDGGGTFAKVPVLIGTVAEEGRSLINRHITLQDFSHAFLNEALFPGGDTAKAILAAYPRAADTVDFDVFAEVFTDFVYQCPTAMLTRQNVHAAVPTWRYLYNTSLPAFLPPSLTWLRKYHGVEYYLFFTAPDDPRHTPQTRELARFVRAAWARFIRDPVGGPGWPGAGVGAGGVVDNVAVLGDAGEKKGMGATVVSVATPDARCAMFQGVLDGIAG